MDINVFPDIVKAKENPLEENLQIQLFGKRLTTDQTVIEYLLEFLLVFTGEVRTEDNQIIKYFKKVKQSKKNGEYIDYIRYTVSPNISLKRLIFFENSKHENRFLIDNDANNILKEQLIGKIDTSEVEGKEVVKIIQNLLHGFSAVTRDRGWFAKSVLPLSEDLIFCESMGKKSKRKNLSFYIDGDINKKVDDGFEFGEHNFFARGGEVYFLHIIQGLDEIEIKHGIEKRNEIEDNIEKGLRRLIETYPQFSKLSKWVLKQWDIILDTSNINANEFKKDMHCRWIKDDYKKRAIFSVMELENILNSDIDIFEKINILADGIVLQILRMMSESASLLSSGNNHPNWIIHIKSNYEADSKIMKLAVESYINIEEDIQKATSIMLENKEDYLDNEVTLLKKASSDTYKLIRKLGKEIGLICPLRGPNIRMTLSDNLVKFLVVSLIIPDKKLTYESFLNKLYKHFGIIISECQLNTTSDMKYLGDVSYLSYNSYEFQVILRKNGFLEELSDATSIVRNPYSKGGLK